MSSHTIVMNSPQMRQTVSGLSSSYSIGVAIHPGVLKIDDKRGKPKGECNPLPIAVLGSSSLSSLVFDPLDMTLCDMMMDTQDYVGQRALNATVTPLTNSFNTFSSATAGQGGMAIYGQGFKAGASFRGSKAVNFTGGYIYDYNYTEEFVVKAVHQVGDKILQASLSRAGSSAKRILIGVMRKVITGDLHVASFDSKSAAAELNVVDGLLDLSVATMSKGRYQGSGVVGVDMDVFVFERRHDHDGYWNVSDPIHVKEWKDERFHKAFKYCREQHTLYNRFWTPRWRKSVTLAGTIEGPRSRTSLTSDRKAQLRASSHGGGSSISTAPTPSATTLTEPNGNCVSYRDVLIANLQFPPRVVHSNGGDALDDQSEVSLDEIAITEE